ncbi:MAG: branched-chain amino acid ABC transporter permease [Rhodopseudomonas sp.]|nr:branched-chain amino acid ABC transporter permease [Rhodopseudomonas sp.]
MTKRGATGHGIGRFASIVIVVAVLAAVPLVVHSNVTLNFLVATLLAALAGQGWNILGGYGGQYSFGHAAFFGTGAYVTAILQVRYGVNAWAGFAAGIAGGAVVGAVIGGLSFRSGLRGSYFALVTLAFAEVLRIVASVTPITGAGVGTLVKLDLHARAFQFESRAVFYWVILAMVAVSLVITHLVERSRFGVWLVAVRENEDAARALGVDVIMVKLGAMVLSAAITAAAGCFYVQYFLFIDSGIAYGTWISIEALLTPIIGGVGTVFGPLFGALVVKSLGEGAKLLAGDAPGLDLVVYGIVLVLVIGMAPRGLVGGLTAARRWCGRRWRPASIPAEEAEHG